jgi:hypothetical protein
VLCCAVIVVVVAVNIGIYPHCWGIPTCWEIPPLWGYTHMLGV